MRIETAEQLSDQLAAALQSGRRRAVLFSDCLEARVYNQPAVADALRSLALEHRHVQVQILIRRSDRVLKGGDHLIIDLARRLPSRIRVLQADAVACEDEREWLSVDDSCCVLRKDADRFDAVYRDDDPGMARQVRQTFARFWAHGEHAPELAQLSL